MVGTDLCGLCSHLFKLVLVTELVGLVELCEDVETGEDPVFEKAIHPSALTVHSID
jgi:hypothetical protein